MSARADRQRAWAIGLAALSLPLRCWGQTVDSASASTPEAPAVQFRALDVHDRREALADLLHRLTLERDSRREEHRAYVEATSAAQALSALPDDDQKLRSCMALSADLGRLEEQLKESRLRRLEVLDRIQAQASQASPASVEGARILREADSEMRLMLSQQEEQARRMALLRRQLTAFVNRIPPPAEFRAASGVAMQLVGVGEAAFYLSVTPLSVGLYRRFQQTLAPVHGSDEWTTYAATTGPDAALTGVSWFEARRFCQWLSALDGVEYRLPPSQEAAVIGSVRPAAGLAFWGDDLWNPDDHVARRDLKRFGVELVTVWDPSAVLAPKPGAFGDVAFARYPSLAIYVVAARQMGVAHRWQRLNTPAP
jgi:formylglycine-generating enzyme required for sulfatase activity